MGYALLRRIAELRAAIGGARRRGLQQRFASGLLVNDLKEIIWKHGAA
jgi:hypothetical protein